MIGRILHGYPSKPAVVVALILILGVMYKYYYDLNRTCTDNETMRSQLYSMAEKNQNNEIRLESVIDSQWHNVRIIVNYKTEGKFLDCPFDWGWTQEHRQQLMDQGKLNMIVITWKGVVTSYLDLNRDRLDFELTETLFTPATGVFYIESNKEKNTGYILHQIK